MPVLRLQKLSRVQNWFQLGRDHNNCYPIATHGSLYLIFNTKNNWERHLIAHEGNKLNLLPQDWNSVAKAETKRENERSWEL